MIQDKEYYDLKSQHLIRPTLFLLSLSMVGLQVPFFLGQISALFIMFRTFFKNRHEFLVQLLIFIVGFGFFGQHNKEFLLYFKTYDIFVLIGPVLLLIYRPKNLLYKKLKLSILLFLLSLFIYLYFHEEPISIQFRKFRQILLLTNFVLPIYIFRYRKVFSVQYFFEKAYNYGIIIVVFTIIQTYFLKVPLLLPNYIEQIQINWEGVFDKNPFGFGFNVRIMPVPFYFVIFSLFLLNFKKISSLQSILIFISILSGLTRSLWGAIIAVLLIRSHFGNKIKFLFSFLLFFFVLLSIDNNTNLNLRVENLVDQITQFNEGTNIAGFGTGRFAQAYGPISYIIKENKIMLGLGFIHPEESKDAHLTHTMLTENYNLEEQSIVGVEVTQIVLLIYLGILGIISYYFFFFKTGILLKKYQYGFLYRDILVFFFILGVGGFSGLQDFRSVSIISFVIGLIVLNNQKGHQI